MEIRIICEITNFSLMVYKLEIKNFKAGYIAITAKYNNCKIQDNPDKSPCKVNKIEPKP